MLVGVERSGHAGGAGDVWENEAAHGRDTEDHDGVDPHPEPTGIGIGHDSSAMTPMVTMALIQGAKSRTLAATKKPPGRFRMSKRV